MTVPGRIDGGFIDSNIVSAKLSRHRGLERDEYEQMVLGKWAWSSDGITHDHFIVFKEDHTCSFQNLKDNKIVRAYEGQCRWKILLKSHQLKMTVPRRVLSQGGFIDSNILSAKLSRKGGLERDEYEQMVLGKWAWSSDDESHDSFIVFREDHTCSLLKLNEETIRMAEGQCRWKILLKSLQLKMSLPRQMGGYFIDSNVLSAQLSRKRGLEAEEYESMILGKWAWSNDGNKTHNHFVVFSEDNTCSFQDLEDRPIAAFEGQCRWKILIKSLQLKMTYPQRMYGQFANANIMRLTRSRGFERDFFE